MSNLETAHVLVKGRVQGVGYRFFAQDNAQAQDLKGWVRNLPNGDVEADVEGPRPAIEQWIEQLRKGPFASRVDRVDVEWKPAGNRYTDFSIR